ncbi:MAG: AsmA family protein, partial [Planctomycetota bacterium]
MKWVKRVVIPLVVLLLIVYFGVPLIIGTSWAKEKVRSAIAKGTGRDVALGSVSFGWFSGLSVGDVRVDQKPGDPREEGPLFELASLDLRVGIGDLLKKKIDIEELEVVEPRIVIIRNEDGSFNFSDLMAKPGMPPASPEPPPAEEPAEAPDAPPEPEAGAGGGSPPVRALLTIRGGRILFIDKKQNTRVEAARIDAEVEWVNGKLDLEMTCELNGGKVRLLACGDLSRKPAPLEVKEFSIDGSEFDTELAQLGYFLPLLGEKPQKASGKIGFVVRDLSATGLDTEGLMESLTAAGNISLSGGFLASAPVSELFGSLEEIGVKGLEALGLDEKERALTVDMFKSTFSVKDGKIFTEEMVLDGAGLQLRFSGWTGLDGTIQYDLALLNLDEVVGGKGKVDRFLTDGVLPLSLGGSLASPKFEFDMAGAVEGKIEEEVEKLKGEAEERAEEKIEEGIEKGLERLFGDKDKEDEEKRKKDR